MCAWKTLYTRAGASAPARVDQASQPHLGFQSGFQRNSPCRHDECPKVGMINFPNISEDSKWGFRGSGVQNPGSQAGEKSTPIRFGFRLLYTPSLATPWVLDGKILHLVIWGWGNSSVVFEVEKLQRVNPAWKFHRDDAFFPSRTLGVRTPI